MDVKLVKITPKMATEWLKHNPKNRTIVAERVATYAAEMTRGNWYVTNQGIALDSGGNLIDGQHRLSAIVASGVTVTMLVVRGVVTEARAAIDRGQIRSVAQEWTMRHGIKSAARWVATLNAINLVLRNGQAAALSYFESKEIADRFDASLGWYFNQFRSGQRKDLGLAPVGGALVAAHSVYPAQVEEFGEALRTGAKLKVGDPALTLRTFLMAEIWTAKFGRFDIARKTLRAIQGHLDGERLSKIYATADVTTAFVKRLNDGVAAPAAAPAAVPAPKAQKSTPTHSNGVARADAPRFWLGM